MNALSSAHMKISDDQFGFLFLDREDPDDAWLTSVQLPYFKTFGQNLDLAPPKRNADPFDTEALFRKGRFRLFLQCGSPPKRPTSAQRLAWIKLLDRGASLWDDVLRRITAEYNLQRPARLDAWKRMYGRNGISRALPNVVIARQMRTLIRPYELYIPRPTDDWPAEVRVKFYSTWFNGLTVRVSDGRMTGFLRNPFCHDPIDLPPTLQHPTFGRLGWQNGAWHGHVRLNPFRHFMNLAQWCTPDSTDPPDSTLGWDLARGEFPIKVFSPAKKPPSPAQAQAFQQFKSRESNHAADVIQSIFDDYIENYPARADQWQGPNMEYLLPELASPADLLDMIELRSINLPRTRKGASHTLAFEFACTWSTGIGVLWKDGRVTQIGSLKIARPPRPRIRKE